MLTGSIDSRMYRFVLMASFSCSSLLNSSVLARDVESEPNDSLTSAQILSAGSDGVDGTLSTAFDPLSPSAMVIADSLQSGVVNQHRFNGNVPGESFVAYIDNEAFVGAPDTTMRSLDENLNQLDVDDDGSPLGNGLGSLIRGNVNSDGSVRLEVSGFSDFDFDGLNDADMIPHAQSGIYELYLQVGFDTQGDVDFYSIPNLEPGRQLHAEIVSATFDTVLAHFDSSGSILETDDDGGEGNLSLLTVTIPSDGMVHLAVTAFADFNLDGDHVVSGNYSLDFRVVVPEPGTATLSGLLVSVLGLVRQPFQRFATS